MRIAVFIILVLFSAGVIRADQAAIPALTSLDPISNGTVKGIRKDVRSVIYVIKSGRSEQELPPLRFYQYRVRKGDSFWNILSRLSLDIDTLMTVNDLSSPRDLSPGKVLFIPNMRGILIKVRGKESMAEVLNRSGIQPRYVAMINNTEDLNRQYLFIPCGKVTNLQRSLFMGIGFVNPLLSGKQTSGFGTRRDPFNRRHQEFHSGIDIACRMNSPVYAARDGIVVFRGFKGNYGKLVIIQHEHGYASYYGHLHNFTVETGKSVKRGDLIALSGNTGRTTGPHLHFEVRKRNSPVNPGILLAGQKI